VSTGLTSWLGWYARRAALISSAEMAGGVPARELAFTAMLPPGTAARAPEEARNPLAGSRRQIGGRPVQRPSRFADARITLLRTSGGNEIWCRCDGRSHGTVGFTAHAHAGALCVEVCYAGVDILAGPGIFCYRGKRAWRSHSRSMIGHNTTELDGRSQSGEGGRFMRVRHAHTREIDVLDDGDIARWTAEHEGDTSLDPPALHRRSVLLDRASRSIDIIDQIGGGSHDILLTFHLGPDVQAELEDLCAVLNWPTASTPGAARLELPPGLQWSLHRGETDPVLGRYFRGSGRRLPAVTLLGCGRCVPGMLLIARLEFLDAGKPGKSAVSRQAISWTSSAALSDRAPEIQAEAR
jgi:heparinase II/III-like protein